MNMKIIRAWIDSRMKLKAGVDLFSLEMPFPRYFHWERLHVMFSFLNFARRDFFFQKLIIKILFSHMLNGKNSSGWAQHRSNIK